VPPWQIVDPEHAFPHVPQLALSNETLAHRPAQVISPDAHVAAQRPDVQT